MTPWNDPRIWIFLWFAAVWILRIRRLIATILQTSILKPIHADSSDNQEFVSVIVPAKNEQNNIQACLEGLLKQDYPQYEIIVINDNSSDQTEHILTSMGAANFAHASAYQTRSAKTNRFLGYLNAPKTGEGWTGKNFALHTGIEKARGSWFLFTDADTRHDPSSLSTAIHYAHSHKLEFLTLLPRCLARSFFEKIIQPLAMAYLGLWFPVEKVKKPHSRVAFANGQYLLIQRRLYEKIEGHANVRGEFLEDFALMKNAKEIGATVECALGINLYGTRMYDSLTAIWRGWRRIYLHAFEQNAMKLFFNALNILLFSTMPYVLAFAAIILAIGDPTANFKLLGSALAVTLMITIVTWQSFQVIRANASYAVFHPISSWILSMILFDAAWMAANRHKTVWR